MTDRLGTVVAHVARQVAGARVLGQGTVLFTPSLTGGADTASDPAILLTIEPVTGMVIDGQLYSPDSTPEGLRSALQLAAEDLVTGQSIQWTPTWVLSDVDPTRQPQTPAFTLSAGETFDLIRMIHDTTPSPDPGPGTPSGSLTAGPDGVPVLTVDGVGATITPDPADGAPVLTITDQAVDLTLTADPVDGAPLLTIGA